MSTSEEQSGNDRIKANPAGGYQWSCRIDREFHLQNVWRGVAGFLAIIFFVLMIGVFFDFSFQDYDWSTIWIVIGVISLITLPLLYLYGSASDPHEQYVLTETYVKSGYDKGSIYTEFRKTKKVVVAADYLELTDHARTNRIYVPKDDMDFVRDYILKRVPKETLVSHR